MIFADGFTDAFNPKAVPPHLSGLWEARTLCESANGFIRLEFMTDITINGVLAFLFVLISMKALGMPQAASRALSNRLQVFLNIMD